MRYIVVILLAVVIIYMTVKHFSKFENSVGKKETQGGKETDKHLTCSIFIIIIAAIAIIVSFIKFLFYIFCQ